ncbi:hypothetical protein MMC26_001449 [Xylographa opegraphella]|nr:hypothetical protein [Xylographa opegraphella]
MDYSYFSTPAQAYPYLGLPPTPTHSYGNLEVPNNDPLSVYRTANGFQTLDQPFQFNPNAFTHQQQQQQLQQQQQQQHHEQHSPPASHHRPSVVALTHSESSNGVTSNGDYDNDQNGNRSSSEEKESLTPAQSRRKAQNRAAQRAFRERKERHVKDLENKLNSLSAHSTTLLTDNERLKRELQKLATQNEILRATTGSASQPPLHHVRPPSPIHGPQTYSPTDFQKAVGVDPKQHPVSYEEFGGEDGERLLSAGATWDLIQGHELCRKGMVDVGDVCRRLKGRAACDGRGPAFRECEVVAAIEGSVICAADELI